MARKRLKPAAAFADVPAPAQDPAAMTRAPIADVARNASVSAALNDLADEMDRARLEGRLAISVPLEAIAAGHLLRDRLDAAIHDEDMVALIASIRARGQQMPIEVSDLGQDQTPRYGLISGWRRLAALRALLAETGEARFATIKAVLRRSDSAAEAYVAMVEENEIRVGLSYYERARVAARSAEAGVFEDITAAIQGLFASGSKAKKSKIGSFVRIYQELDDLLVFPAALPERLGLRVAQALAAGQGEAIRIALRAAAPADAQAEQTVLAAALDGGGAVKPPQEPAVEVAPGIHLKRKGQTLTLSGGGITPDLEAALADWLRARG